MFTVTIALCMTADEPGEVDIALFPPLQLVQASAQARTSQSATALKLSFISFLLDVFA
jgi:hypothetical protein